MGQAGLIKVKEEVVEEEEEIALEEELQQDEEEKMTENQEEDMMIKYEQHDGEAAIDSRPEQPHEQQDEEGFLFHIKLNKLNYSGLICVGVGVIGVNKNKYTLDTPKMARYRELFFIF
jgi:hypothetical protein